MKKLFSSFKLKCWLMSLGVIVFWPLFLYITLDKILLGASYGLIIMTLVTLGPLIKDKDEEKRLREIDQLFHKWGARGLTQTEKNHLDSLIQS